MKKKALTLIYLLAFCGGIFSQTILLEQDVNSDTILPTTGPNMKNYTHSYFGYGFILGQPDTAGADIKPGWSNEFSFGFRYKRRISNFYSVGFDFFYGNANYLLKQDSTKIFPNPTLHKKEKIAYNNTGLVLYNRINFGQRGNIIGNFMDVGVYGEWGFIIKHYYRDELPVAQTGASVREVTNKGLLYTNNINYGAVARFGINRYVLFAKYRVSDLLKADYLVKTGLKYPELPRIVAGIEIGLLK